MSTFQKILFFFILPIFALMVYPPSFLLGSIPIMVFLIALFVLLGWIVMRGRSSALTFMIFLQGLNIIIRLMMFFARAIPKDGVADYPFIIVSILGIVVSLYLLVRLDQSDIRITMTHQ